MAGVGEPGCYGSWSGLRIVGFLSRLKPWASSLILCELELADRPLRIPTVVVHEIYRAVGMSDRPNDNADRYEKFFSSRPVVPLDENIARRAGVLDGKSMASDANKSLGVADAVIAATGLVHDEAVVSDDSDLMDVDGLEVETY